jgi:hypothetical protein
MAVAMSVGAMELGVLMVRGRAVRLLGPGRYRFFGRLAARGEACVARLSRRTARLRHPLLDSLLTFEPLRRLVHVVDVAPGQYARVWSGDRLLAVLMPGRAVFWSEASLLEVDRLALPAGALSAAEAMARALGAPPTHHRARTARPGGAASVARPGR